MRPAALEHNLEETHQNFEGAAHFCKGALRAGEPEAAASVVDDEQTREYEDCVQRKIRAAKRAARSELSVSKGEWTKHGYHRSNVLSVDGVLDSVPRVDCKDVSPEEFFKQFEEPRLPAVITGLTDTWRGKWTADDLLARFGDHKFKVGSDDDGYAVRLKFKHYWKYIHDPIHSKDDSPLYIFDGTFADRRTSRAMRKDYSVPPYFAEDLMRLAGEKRRPPYRWFVMGPARSGSGVHVDPLATSAWNALLHGHKRWALFPPSTPRALVQPKEPGLERESVNWFTHVYPRTQQSDWPAAKPIDIIQKPGETVFVPGGWWHAILNLDVTIAVTQNFASTASFSRVWAHTHKGRPKMSTKWSNVLKEERPDLRAVVVDMAGRGLDREGTSSSSSASSSSSSSDSSSSTSTSSSSSSDSNSKQQRRKRARQELENGHGPAHQAP